MKTLSHSCKNEKSPRSDAVEKLTSRFQSTFKLAFALRAAHAYKSKGVPVSEIFTFLVNLAFKNLSLFRALQFENSSAHFSKDTCYRFLNSSSINWNRFLNVLSLRVMQWLDALTSETRKTSFIVDDTPFKRNRSHRVELATSQFDHSTKSYYTGFRCLCLAWSDGNSTIPVDFGLLSSEKGKTALETSCPDKRRRRSCGYAARSEAVSKATEVMLLCLKRALSLGCRARYVLFDSWFTSPAMLSHLLEMKLYAVAMVKQSTKLLYRSGGKLCTVKTIYDENCKRRGRSKYLLSVTAEMCRSATSEAGELNIPVKLVFVRKNEKVSRKAKNYLVLVSTDTTLTEKEIIQLYRRRWNIEVFFKICKTLLRFGKESRSISYDAMRASLAIVFVRYLILAWEQRVNTDVRTIGDLFFEYAEELQEADWKDALQALLTAIIVEINKNDVIVKVNIEKCITSFLENLPVELRQKLKCA